MKTGTITIRLPEDKIERLKALAKKQNISVTELLRDPISTWLDLGAIGQSSDEELLEQLKELKEAIQSNQQSVGNLLMGMIAGISSARYFASLAATFGDEMSLFIKDGTKLTEDQRNQRAAGREQQALLNESLLIEEVLKSQQPPPEEVEGI